MAPPADLECSGHAPIVKISKHQFNSFLEHLLVLESGECWHFNYNTLSNDGLTFAQAIQHGDAITISDGSFQDQFSTAVWIVEGLCSIGRIVGDVTVYGAVKDQSTYQSELTGINSHLVCAKQLCKFFHITYGSIELRCDGQLALDKAFNYVSIIRIEDPNYDLLFVFHTLWAHPPLTWMF